MTRRKKITTALLSILSAVFILVAVSIFFDIPALHKIRYYIDKIENRFKPHDNQNMSVAAGYDIYGIDISWYNGKIDWRKLLSKGRINNKPVSFVIIKATEGSKLKDKRYKANRRNAKKHGLLCGAYHFYRPEVNSMEQFTNFRETVKLDKGDFPPVLDVEVRGNLSYKRYTQGILNLLELMENHYGAKPIIYAPPTLYATLARRSEFNKYPVWLATYSNNIPEKHKKKIFLVQYSKTGRVAGISHDVDLNGFKGNKMDLQKYLIK